MKDRLLVRGAPRKKKALGQHFLRKRSVVYNMIDKVSIGKDASVLEIGCGDGFLTRAILGQTDCKLLKVYEIDQEWADFVRKDISDPRLDIELKNILDVDLSVLDSGKPWVLLANLPYQITFPIFFLLRRYRSLFSEGVVMVQEEVARKIVASRGKPYSATTIFLQHSFDFELMEKIGPESFSPPPKVHSRLLYFRPKKSRVQIDDEEKFWKFLKLCFRCPRQTLKNNLRTTHYDISKIPEQYLGLRAQQMEIGLFLDLFKLVS